jgi:hypothetical protein
VEERKGRPDVTEYAPFFAGYIGRVPAGDIVDILRVQMVETARFLRGIPDAQTTSGYAPGKWSIRDVVGHLSDTERVMSYRAMRFARADRTPVPGFDENTYVPAAQANDRTMSVLVSELEAVRAASVALFAGMPAEAWRRSGVSNNHEISVRALAAIVAGHERHHVAIIRERYLTVR